MPVNVQIHVGTSVLAGVATVTGSAGQGIMWDDEADKYRKAQAAIDNGAAKTTTCLMENLGD